MSAVETSAESVAGAPVNPPVRLAGAPENVAPSVPSPGVSVAFEKSTVSAPPLPVSPVTFTSPVAVSLNASALSALPAPNSLHCSPFQMNSDGLSPVPASFMTRSPCAA